VKDAYPAIPDRLKRLGVPDSEWFIACKDGLRWLMRPGMPLKVRVSICMILYSQGYNNELAMKQVQGEASGDKALFVALTPEAIISILQKFAIEEMRRSGILLDDGQRKALRVSSPNMRACLEELEQEHGTITRVYAKDPRKLIGLTFDEAMEKRLVTPIENLSQHERKKLARRSYIVVHTHPRAATQKALTRRVDEELLNPPSKDNITSPLDGPKRVAFHFLKQAGKPDAKLAAKVAVRNDFQGGYAKIVQGDATKKEGLIICRRVAELAAQGSLFDENTPVLDLSQPSAVLNPNGHGLSGESTPPTARTADTPTPTAQGRQAGNSSPERDRASSPAPPSRKEVSHPESSATEGAQIESQAAAPVDLVQPMRPPGVPGSAPLVGHASGGERDSNGRQPGQPGAHGPDAGGNRAQQGAPARLVEPQPQSPDWDAVGRAAAQYATIDDAWVRAVVKACQRHTADVTPAEVAQVVHLKGPVAAKKDNPAGLLFVAVPNFCQGESFRRFRVRIAEEARQIERAEQKRRQIEAQRDRQFAKATMADKDATDEDRAWARKTLGIQTEVA